MMSRGEATIESSSVLTAASASGTAQEAPSRSATGAFSIQLSRKSIVRALAVPIVVLGVLNLAHQISWIEFGYDYREFGWKWDLAGEANIPSWYASITLLLCAALIWYISAIKLRERAPYRWHWRGLALIFIFLSLDEAAAIHEWSDNLLATYNLEGFFYYAWVVFGIAFVLVVGALYLPFLLRLPRRTAQLFVLAGCLYVGGALIVEMTGARYEFVHGGATAMTYQLIAAFEELCEMVGVLIFVYALLRVLEELTVGREQQVDGPAAA